MQDPYIAMSIPTLVHIRINEIDTLDAMSSKRRPDCVCKNRCFHKSQSRCSLFLRLLSFVWIVVLSRDSCSVGQTSSVKYYTLGVRTCWPENTWRCETTLQDEPSASDTWGQKERRIRNHVANVPLSHRRGQNIKKARYCHCTGIRLVGKKLCKDILSLHLSKLLRIRHMHRLQQFEERKCHKITNK